MRPEYWRHGDNNRALKHFINAKFGCDDDSLDGVKLLYKDGYASKDDFYAALRDYQTVEATKSPQREEAAECEEWANKMRGI